MDPLRWQSHRLRNLFQSAALLAAMAALLGTLGWLLAGSLGVIVAGAGVAVIWVFSPAVSPKLALQMSGASALPRHAAPALHEAVRELAARAKLDPIPALHYVPGNAVNAFAFGDAQRSALAVSDGLLRVLSRRELTGVLAHEISHIRNGDTWVLSLATRFSRITQTLSTAGLLLLILSIPLVLLGIDTFSIAAMLVLVLAPTLSGLLHLALSRTREFDADLGAVALEDYAAYGLRQPSPYPKDRGAHMKTVLARRRHAWPRRNSV